MNYSEDPVLRRLQMESEYERQVNSRLVKAVSICTIILVSMVLAYDVVRWIL